MFASTTATSSADVADRGPEATAPHDDGNAQRYACVTDGVRGTLDAHRMGIAELVAGLDPDLVPTEQSRVLWTSLAEIERLVTAGMTVLARRVDDSKIWEREGMRSAAEYLAMRSGGTRDMARHALSVSKKLKDLPQIESTLRRGELSAVQAHLIADAASENPTAQQRLLDAAERLSLPELREECARVKAAADPDPEATRQKLRARRRLRQFNDTEGFWHAHAQGNPDVAGVFNATLNPIIDELFHHARTEGRHEPRNALAFDAFIEMARRAHTATYGDDRDDGHDRNKDDFNNPNNPVDQANNNASESRARDNDAGDDKDADRPSDLTPDGIDDVANGNDSSDDEDTDDLSPDNLDDLANGNDNKGKDAGSHRDVTDALDDPASDLKEGSDGGTHGEEPDGPQGLSPRDSADMPDGHDDNRSDEGAGPADANTEASDDLTSTEITGNNPTPKASDGIGSTMGNDKSIETGPDPTPETNKDMLTEPAAADDDGPVTTEPETRNDSDSGTQLLLSAHDHTGKAPNRAQRRAQQQQLRKKRTKQPNPTHLPVLRIDLEALRRGHTKDYERCEVTGTSPISIPAARELLDESIVKLVITKDGEVVNVTHIGQGPLAALRLRVRESPLPEDRPQPTHLALIHVDVQALARRARHSDELRDIEGAGAISIPAARDLLGPTVLDLATNNGVAVTRINHKGRKPTVAQRIALLWTQPACTVAGCPHTFTQIDHREDWAKTHYTRLDLLDRLCPHHHRLKSHHGWALVPGTGKRPFVPPDDPRHPKTGEHDAGGTHARRERDDRLVPANQPSSNRSAQHCRTKAWQL